MSSNSRRKTPTKTPRTAIGEFLDASKTHTQQIVRNRQQGLIRTPEPVLLSNQLQHDRVSSLQRRRSRRFSQGSEDDTPRQAIEGFLEGIDSTRPVSRYRRRVSQAMDEAPTRQSMSSARSSTSMHQSGMLDSDATPKTLLQQYIINTTADMETPGPRIRVANNSTMVKTPEALVNDTYQTPSPFRDRDSFELSPVHVRTDKFVLKKSGLTRDLLGDDDDSRLVIPESQPYTFDVPSVLASSPSMDEEEITAATYTGRHRDRSHLYTSTYHPGAFMPDNTLPSDMTAFSPQLASTKMSMVAMPMETSDHRDDDYQDGDSSSSIISRAPSPVISEQASSPAQEQERSKVMAERSLTPGSSPSRYHSANGSRLQDRERSTNISRSASLSRSRDVPMLPDDVYMSHDDSRSRKMSRSADIPMSAHDISRQKNISRQHDISRSRDIYRSPLETTRQHDVSRSKSIQMSLHDISRAQDRSNSREVITRAEYVSNTLPEFVSERYASPVKESSPFQRGTPRLGTPSQATTPSQRGTPSNRGTPSAGQGFLTPTTPVSDRSTSRHSPRSPRSQTGSKVSRRSRSLQGRAEQDSESKENRSVRRQSRQSIGVGNVNHTLMASPIVAGRRYGAVDVLPNETHMLSPRASSTQAAIAVSRLDARSPSVSGHTDIGDDVTDAGMSALDPQTANISQRENSRSNRSMSRSMHGHTTPDVSGQHKNRSIARLGAQNTTNSPSNQVDDAGDMGQEDLADDQMMEVDENDMPVTAASSVVTDKKLTKAAGPKKLVRKPRAKSIYTVPVSVVKKQFNHFAEMRVSPEAITEVMKVSETYWDNLCDDLKAYAKHAGRKRINLADCELLFKRQGYVTEKQTLNSLIRRYLPWEEADKLIHVARAFNRIEPKL